jgi:quinol-cytochrome oxidoreductase complex cytochrome b subunit
MGGITLFLVGVQVMTGILLLLYYRPSAGEPTKASSSSCRRWNSAG